MLRTVTPESFREDPLRILRGLRLVSQLFVRARAGDACPDARRGGRAPGMSGGADRRRRCGGRDGRAVEAAARDASGRRPCGSRARRARSPRWCRSSPRRSATRVASPRQPLTLDEHLFAVAQCGRRRRDDAARPARGAPPRRRRSRRPTPPANPMRRRARPRAGRILRRLRYPNALRESVVRLVAAHDFRLDGGVDAAVARRFLASHGLEHAP